MGTDTENNAFNHGYVIACCNMFNLQGDSVIAWYTLIQLGVTQAQIDAMDLCEYDTTALAEIRNARSNEDCILMEKPEAGSDETCVLCTKPSVTNLDDNALCQDHADAWVRGEGQAAAENQEVGYLPGARCSDLDEHPFSGAVSAGDY